MIIFVSFLTTTTYGKARPYPAIGTSQKANHHNQNKQQQISDTRGMFSCFYEEVKINVFISNFRLLKDRRGLNPCLI